MKKIFILMLLLSTLTFGQALGKLEQSYLSKAEGLQADHDSKVKALGTKLSKDSKRLAEAYLKALKALLKAETQKGDFDAAVKVKAKVTEMENILKGQVTRPEVVKTVKPIRRLPPQITNDPKLAPFKGTWEITDRNETIIYEIKNNEVWHKYIKRGSISYSIPQKVEYIIINGILGMQHIAWENGKPFENKHNWIDLKNNRAIHTFQKDPSKMHGSYRKLTKIAKKIYSIDSIISKQGLIGKVLKLDNNAIIYSNRTFKWGVIPKELNGFSYIQGKLRVRRDIKIEVTKKCTLYCFFSTYKNLHKNRLRKLDEGGWVLQKMKLADGLVYSKSCNVGSVTVPWIHANGDTIVIFKDN